VSKFDIFKKPIIVIDGGTGTELQRVHGLSLTAPLWSSVALRLNIEAVREVHRAFLEAGAEIVETATFRSNPESYAQAGLSREDSWRDTVLAAHLARESVDEINSKALVAGSIAPVSDSYKTDLAPREVMRDNHLTQALALKEGGVDLLMLETVPTLEEASYMVEAATEVELPFIITFTVGQDGRLLDGNSLSKAAQTTEHENRVAIGVNCSKIEDAGVAVQELLDSGYPGAVAIYANGISEDEGPQQGGSDDLGWRFSEGARREAAAQKFVQATLKLVGLIRENGNNVIVGGCCGITHDEIALLSKESARNFPDYLSTAREISTSFPTARLSGTCCPSHEISPRACVA